VRPQSPQPEIFVEPTAEALAGRAGGEACVALAAAQRARGEAQLVITGGGILEHVLAAIADVPQHETVDWARVHVWWGDERYVPSGSDDRNDRPAAAKLIDRLPFDPAKVHRMPASDAGFARGSGQDSDGLDAAADSYAAELAAAAPDGAAVPAFDVVLLGLGPDGHCCSLFPNHPGTKVLDKAVIGVRESPKPPPERLSLTFPTLDAAREVWFIASGEGKADAVAAALAPGANREQVPSSGPRGTDGTRWLLDEAAAGKLTR
jgi:6-phosphogluconolactonase